MFLDFLFLLADSSSETISIDFFKWACLGLVGGIAALAKAYVSQGNKKDKEISELNSKILDNQKEENISRSNKIQQIHDHYQKEIKEIVAKKDATIKMIQNAKEQSDIEAFEKITLLLNKQTELALANQQYIDKMMSIMRENTDHLDDAEHLMQSIKSLLEQNSDLKVAIDQLRKSLKDSISIIINKIEEIT